MNAGYSGKMSEKGAVRHLLGSKRGSRMFFFLEFASSNQFSINEAKKRDKSWRFRICCHINTCYFRIKKEDVSTVVFH